MSKLEKVYEQKGFQYLYEVETLAQDILTDKETKLDISNARNKFREALRALESTEERRTWMQLGSIYVERPTKECIEMLRKELQSADTDLKNLDEKIKNKVCQLRDLEHQPGLQGLHLKPISVAEAKVFNREFRLA